jgi:hypothetical protein
MTNDFLNHLISQMTRSFPNTGKICATSNIKFIADIKKNKTIKLIENDKFSSSLTTLLVRDKKVVAVLLKVSTNGYNIYIAKNDE